MELNVGDIVEYCTYSGGIKTIRVAEVRNDLKNNAPGFVGEQLMPGFYGNYIWCYKSQVIRKLNHSDLFDNKID